MGGVFFSNLQGVCVLERALCLHGRTIPSDWFDIFVTISRGALLCDINSTESLDIESDRGNMDGRYQNEVLPHLANAIGKRKRLRVS